MSQAYNLLKYIITNISYLKKPMQISNKILVSGILTIK